MMLDRTDFDINNVIRETAASFEGTCRGRKLKIDLVMTDERMLVYADMERIRQVLYNLTDNAIKFSHDGDTITIETTEKGAKVFVSVKDTGIGIPKEQQGRIFERFYRVDPDESHRRGGTGLGLAIVSEIVEAHGAQIAVSGDVGVGTTFTVTFPEEMTVREGEDDVSEN